MGSGLKHFVEERPKAQAPGFSALCVAMHPLIPGAIEDNS